VVWENGHGVTGWGVARGLYGLWVRVAVKRWAWR
jgi:hypothetical protein